jgi:protein-disulfide isomerase
MLLRHSLIVFCLAVAACTKPDADPKPPATPAPAFDLARVDKARQTGSEGAKIWFIMASDFECPFCKRFHDETWPSIERDYVRTGKVRVAFMNFPMNMKAPPMHPRSVAAAEVAMCAGAQDKFWQMHDSLFMNQDKWAGAADPMPIWESLAKSLGLDVAAWRSCMTSHSTRPTVDQDFSRLKPLGVEGTPSFVIGNALAVVGAAPYADFRKAIDSALAHAR